MLNRAPTGQKPLSGHAFTGFRARTPMSGALAGESGGDVAEFCIEGLAIGGDKRLLQEFVDSDAFTAALFEGAAADVPAVEVEGCQAVAEHRGPDGVEAAGDGLHEGASASAVRPFDGAEAATFLKAGVGALLASVEEGSHDIAVAVDLEIAGFRNLLPAGGTHPRFVFRVVLFELGGLLFQERCAAVSDDAACTATALVIAAETLREYLRRDQDIPDLDD